jgi:hypothetical protein
MPQLSAQFAAAQDYGSSSGHRLVVKNMVAQDEQKVFNGKTMVPDSLRLHIGQGFPGAFAKARTANASGFANHVIAIHRV